MSENRLEPLPPDIQRLLERERDLPRVPTGDREEILRRISLTLLAVPLPHASGPAGSEVTAEVSAPAAGAGATAAPAAAGGFGGALKALAASRIVTGAALFVLGGASGAGLHALASRSTGVPASPPPPAVTVAPSDPRPPALPAAGQGTSGPRPEPIRPEIARAGSAGTLAVERRLLEVARTAISRGQGAAAIAQLQLHAERFPRGQLAEEREALWVQALLGAGRHSEAKAKGAKFEKDFPNSMLLPMVRASLQSIP